MRVRGYAGYAGTLVRGYAGYAGIWVRGYAGEVRGHAGVRGVRRGRREGRRRYTGYDVHAGRKVRGKREGYAAAP